MQRDGTGVREGTRRGRGMAVDGLLADTKAASRTDVDVTESEGQMTLRLESRGKASLRNLI